MYRCVGHAVSDETARAEESGDRKEAVRFALAPNGRRGGSALPRGN
jgi:hypothetical protein